MINAMAASGGARIAQYTRGVLQQALNRAVKWDLVPRNVVLATDRPRSTPRTITPLTEAEAQRLLDTPMEPRNLHRHFKLALKRAGLPTTTRFHDLRHSCATFLLAKLARSIIAQGVHPRVVMEILGHSQISLTMNTFGHVQPETQRDATTKIAGTFVKREPKPEPEQPDQTIEAEP